MVCPIIREWLDTASDIAIDAEDLFKKYNVSQPICEGITFDFSLLHLYSDPNLWQVYTISSLKKQRQILSKISEFIDGKTNHKELILDGLRNSELETNIDLY